MEIALNEMLNFIDRALESMLKGKKLSIYENCFYLKCISVYTPAGESHCIQENSPFVVVGESTFLPIQHLTQVSLLSGVSSWFIKNTSFVSFCCTSD